MERSQALVGILHSGLETRRQSNSSLSSSFSVYFPQEESGLEEPGVNFRHQTKHRLVSRWCLRGLDFVLAFSVFPAAVTILWRGIWQYLDVTLTTMPPGANIDDYPDQKWQSIWISLPICLVLSFVLNSFQFECSAFLKKWSGNGVTSRLKSFLLTVILKGTILVSLFLGVACWRGFWDLWDLMLYKVSLMNTAETKFQLAVILFVLVNSYVLMCWPLQVSRSLLSTPLQVSPDGGIEDIFESPTLFNRKPPRNDHQSYLGFDIREWNWYFFDVFASTFLVQFLAVTAWWGLWTFEDKTLGPANSFGILTTYLLIGYSFSSVAFALQFTVTKEIPTLPQKFWSEFVVSLGFVGVVSLWKGIWDYSDVLISPAINIDDRATNLVVQITLAYLVLLAFNNTSLASNRGVVIDCPETFEARNQDIFILDNFASASFCCGNTANGGCHSLPNQPSHLSFIYQDETRPLLE